MTITVNGIHQQRRGTAAALAAQNPLLKPGETILEVGGDPLRSKTNNSLSTPLYWNDLGYDGVGERGEPGPSPWQRAVQLGYEGSEEDWYASLQGPPGAPGTSWRVEESEDPPPAVEDRETGVLYVRY